jgi:hypothetical protein
MTSYQDLPICQHPNGLSKRTYRSPAKAKRASRLTGDVKLYTYHCPICRWYHITSSPPRTPRIL